MSQIKKKKVLNTSVLAFFKHDQVQLALYLTVNKEYPSASRLLNVH